MNAPVRPPADTLGAVREEVWHLLQSVAHYAHCAQSHLEVGDDLVALYDLRAAREYFIAAIREFEPLKIHSTRKCAEVAE